MRRNGIRRLLLLVVLLPILSCSPRPKQPDIVLITIDTIRAGHLGCYGYFRDTSPALDAFARESLLFERCVVPMATTFPSHLSLLTGVYPYEHGITANTADGAARFTPSPTLRSFAQVAADGGYRTAAIVSATPLKHHTGIGAGFSLFDEPPGSTWRAEEPTEAALRWLTDASAGDEPLFLWVHYFDPHAPYDPPAPYDGRFSPDRRTVEYLIERKFNKTVAVAADDTVETLEVLGRYDGEILYMDGQIRRLLDRLKGSDRWERTMVILVGDHGEGLGQHGRMTHGYIWDEQLHAPLLVRIPGVAPGRVKTLTSLIDVFPSLEKHLPALAGDPFWGQVSGEDVLSGGAGERMLISCSSARRRTEKEPFQVYCLTGERWKYVHHAYGERELFDLQSDPHELENLFSERQAMAAAMAESLATALRKCREKRYALYAGALPETEQIDEKTRRELKSLGYIE